MNLRKLIKKYLKGKTNALEDNQVDEFYHYLPSEGHDLNDFNEEEKTALEKAIWQKIQLAKDSRKFNVETELLQMGRCYRHSLAYGWAFPHEREQTD